MIQVVYSLADEIEKRITNGLGYSQLDHYTDDDKGLMRHLFEMERISKIHPVIDTSFYIGHRLANMAEKNQNAVGSLLEVIGIIINNPSNILSPTCLPEAQKKLRKAGEHLSAIQYI